MESINKENLISIKESLEKIAKEIKKDRNDLYDEISRICEEIDCLFSDNDDYSWPMSIRDLCYNFDINRNTVNTHKRRYLKEGKDYFTDGTGPDRALCFYKCGALKIFEHCKTDKGTRYKRKHGSSILPTEEHLYLNTIKYALSEFEITKKVVVKTSNKDYEIDLYLQNRKLAIECDEHDHYMQEYIDELVKREKDIINELGCRFLRFNPHEPDFNVGEVINVIFHYISNKLINGKDLIDYYMDKRKRQRTIRERKYPKLTEEQLAEFE